MFLWFRAAVRPYSVASPGVLSQPPLSSDRFLGRRPSVLPAIARGRVTTDSQSPKGGSQRFRHSRSKVALAGHFAPDAAEFT